MIPLLLTAGVIITVATAAYTDLRTRRIPNLITVTGLSLALSLRFLMGDGVLVDGVAGIALGTAIVVPLFAIKALGGGDAKLLMAVGAFLGFNGLLVALLGTALAGGVMAMAVALRRGVLLPLLLNTGDLVRYCASFGKRGSAPTVSAPTAVKIPYGIAIAVGSLSAVFLGAGI